MKQSLPAVACALTLALAPLLAAGESVHYLDAGAKEIAKQLVEKASDREELKELTVAVADLADSEKKGKPFSTLSEALTGALADTGAFAKVLERPQMEKVVAEAGKSLSAMFDETTVPELGKLIGAQLAVVGTYTLQPDAGTIQVRVRLVQVETGVVVSSAKAELLASSDLKQALTGQTEPKKPEPEETEPDKEPTPAPQPESGKVYSDLNAAARQIATELVRQAPSADELKKLTVAVVPFADSQKKGRPFASLSEVLMGEVIRTEAFAVVVENSQVERLLEETGKSLSAVHDETKAPELGKLLSAQALVLGTYLIKTGTSTIQINARLAGVEKGGAPSSSSVSIVCTQDILNELMPEQGPDPTLLTIIAIAVVAVLLIAVAVLRGKPAPQPAGGAGPTPEPMDEGKCPLCKAKRQDDTRYCYHCGRWDFVAKSEVTDRP